jgi:hypothetical protein
MAFIELKKVETTFDVAGPITVNVSDIVKVAPHPDGIGSNVTIRGERWRTAGISV